MIKGRPELVLFAALTYMIYLSGRFIAKEQYLIIAVLYLAVAVLLVLLNQKKAFYLLIILLPFGFFVKSALQFFMPGLLASVVGVYKDMLIFFLLASVTSLVFVKKKYSFSFSPLYFPLILFVFFCIVEFLVNSQTYLAGIVGLRRTIMYIFMVLIVVSVLNTREDVVKFIKYVVLVGIVLAFGAVAQWVFFPKLLTSGTFAGGGLYRYSFSTGRASSLVQSPNVLGFYLAFIGAYLFGDIFYEKRFGLLLLKTAALLTVVAGLFMTLSRGAWVAIFCGASLWALFKFKYLFRKFFFFALILVVAFILVINIPVVHFRLMSVFDPDDVSRQARMSNLFVKYAVTTEDMKTFLFGRGLGTTGAVPEAFEKEGFKSGFLDLYYLELYTDIGIVGVALFLWIMARYFRVLVRTERRTRDPFLKQALNGVMAATLTFLFSGFFTGIGASFEAGVFWSFMGVSVVIQDLVRDESPSLEGTL